MKRGIQSDEDLVGEAVQQLRHHDDRRDAAEMRVEELVRDTEFEPEAIEPEAIEPEVEIESGVDSGIAAQRGALTGQRSFPRALVFAVAGAVALLLYLLSRALPS